MRGLILSCVLVLGVLPAGRAAEGTDRPYLLARKTLLQVQVQWLDEPQLSPDGRMLLFRRQDEDNGSDAGPWNLWIADADGTGARLLARNAHHARWSPHSKRIAFLRGGEENDDPDGKQPPPPDLWTIRPDGTDARKVAPNVAGWNTAWYNGMPAYAWSPDGSRLTYAGARGSNWSGALWEMEPDGAHRRRLLSLPGDCCWRWPDSGRRLCLWEHVPSADPKPKRPARSRSWIADLATGKVTELQAPLRGAYPGQCAFSPDGKYLALLCFGPQIDVTKITEDYIVRSPRMTVWVKDLAANQWRMLDWLTGWEADLSWSPRSDRLLASIPPEDEGDHGAFSIWRPNGEAICRGQAGHDLHWSPGGGRLTFLLWGDGCRRIRWACDSAGRLRTEIGDVADYPGGSCWTPDGMSLIWVKYGFDGHTRPAIERVDLTRP